MLSLDQLGPRICVLGPSGSGKSTLAQAIGVAKGLPVVHLDVLYHLPGTDWLPRPPGDFATLHEAAIAAPEWVLDGNYSANFPRRFACATGVILLDVPTATSLWRYVRRCLFERERAGALLGGRDSIKWKMIHHIVGPTRRNRQRYAREVERLDIPVLRLGSPRELTAFYRAENLDRQARQR
ncbi:AAA family ATPase [Novosphingobium profundi]|uniref:AAA family ATPase n=1 Tax=Novosphingobium profundi TaxID=1774954 RepID=UPI001BD988DE|nr:AAA family ATPase [Novosphingobium profundi]MBT0668055.1 AAA family ATPase [Novosphingobium profundi]